MRPLRRSSRDCSTFTEDALVSHAACQPVGIEALEQHLGRFPPDAEQIAEAGERGPPCGFALGDKYGRKGALSVGLVIFGTFSAAASVATSPEMLIASRALMGIGAAFIFPTTLSILTNTFEGKERAKAIGVWAGVSGLGVAIGPLIGGTLVEHFSWGAVFLVNVPICILGLVAGYFFVPTSRDPDNRALSPLGAVLSILALLGILYAIIQAPEVGWTAPAVVGSLRPYSRRVAADSPEMSSTAPAASCIRAANS